jgi:hypothetical protein
MAIGIYVDWWPEQRARDVPTRRLNWPARSRRARPLWVQGTLNAENEVQDDPDAALAVALGITKAQSD